MEGRNATKDVVWRPVQITLTFAGGVASITKEARGALRITKSPLVPSMKAPVVRGSAGAFLCYAEAARLAGRVAWFAAIAACDPL
jgi:hypothetical protein